MLARQVEPDYLSRLDYTPSSYQLEVFRMVRTTNRNLVVKAVAGSGKSKTLHSVALMVTGRTASVAFNKSIADELAKKLAGTGMESSTTHALARRVVIEGLPEVYVKVEKYKYSRMIRSARDAAKAKGTLCGERLTDEQRKVIKDEGFPEGDCERLLNLARLALLDMDADDFPAQIRKLAERHDVDSHPCLWPVIETTVRNCMWIGCELPEQSYRRPTFEIDYTDMLWLPHVHNLRPRVGYDVLCVDECQDISKAGRRFLMSCLAPNGRLIWVGDKKQACYGFAGADADSFDAIIEESNAVVLPLSVCYRCPTSHLDIARRWCPEIEARPGAPVGTVIRMEIDDYIAKVMDGDLIICRRNAPLLSLCFELIAAGVPAVVRGTDIVSGLQSIVEKISKACRRWDDFGSEIDRWGDKQIAAARKRITDDLRLDEAIDRINDKVECVRVIWSHSDATSCEQLCKHIKEMFSDERASVTLSSIHRAKGLEADRVGILEPERLHSSRATQEWQLEQEGHLGYIAYTRSRRDLLLIPGRDR
jgi:DNA helicase-2/ATP-dependent DNA helicase PcrA